MKFLSKESLRVFGLSYFAFTTYITIECCFRTYSYPLMGCLAIIAVLLGDCINDYISWDMDLVLQSSVVASIITLMELFVGLIQQHFHLVQMWDYSNIPMNYKGIICVPFFFLWMVMGAISIIVADCYNYYLDFREERPRYTIMGYTIYLPERREG